MRYTSDETLDLILNEYMEADERSICSYPPTTFFNACWPDMWVAETAFVIGDTTRPPTDNGMVYECTASGTSGVGEPPWSEVQDETFADGTVTWKAHENYALVNGEILPGEKTKGAGTPDGRSLTIAQKMGVTVHTGGTVSHTALIDTVGQTLKYVTPAYTSLDGDNMVVSGRTTLLHEVVITVRAPSAPEV